MQLVFATGQISETLAPIVSEHPKCPPWISMMHYRVSSMQFSRYNLNHLFLNLELGQLSTLSDKLGTIDIYLSTATFVRAFLPGP